MAWETGVQSHVEYIQKSQKMVLDISILNSQHYKVHIKSNVEQSDERNSAFFYSLV